MHSASTPGSDSQIHRAFYALTQYRSTIAQIMLDTPRLARMYQVLLWLSMTTIAVSVMTASYAFLTTGLSVWVSIPLAVFAVIFYNLPLKASAVATLVGTLGFGAQIYPAIPPLSLQAMFVALAFTGVVTMLVLGYLMKHAIIIGDQLWQQLVEQEMSGVEDDTGTSDIDDPSSGEGERTGDEPVTEENEQTDNPQVE